MSKNINKDLTGISFVYVRASVVSTGCKMVTHRDCHYETTAMCTSDAVKHMDM